MPTSKLQKLVDGILQAIVHEIGLNARINNWLVTHLAMTVKLAKNGTPYTGASQTFALVLLCYF